MSIISSMRSRPVLFVAYLLFIVSMVLPTFAFDLGTNDSPVQPGYKIFLGGPVGALGIILEPGSEPGNRVLGLYYVFTWLANFALILPFLGMIPQTVRRVLGGASALLAWSLIGSYFLIENNLISEIGSGYYLWSLSITLILYYLMRARSEPVSDYVRG